MENTELLNEIKKTIPPNTKLQSQNMQIYYELDAIAFYITATGKDYDYDINNRNAQGTIRLWDWIFSEQPANNNRKEVKI